MGLLEYILAVVLVITTLFIFFYIFYKKIENKLFFLAACFGVYCFIEILLIVATAPFSLFFIKILPQLAEQEQVEYLIPFLAVSEFVQEYWYVVFHPILAVWIPVAIHKRYDLFQSVRRVD
ncbi:hypothetical protein KFE80_13185 [bacterium SCSIO 12696]|nr:hypothetical protein KFE80_13185 [bacterium SCSIO 12696]